MKAVTNAGVVTSRVGAVKGKAENLQTLVPRGLDQNERVQTTLLMVTPWKDTHVDLMEIKSSLEYIADTDKTPTVKENVDLWSDPSGVIFPL